MANPPNRELVVCPDAGSVACDGARRFAGDAAAAIQERGRFAVALSGGSTPKRLFELLAQDPYLEEVDWQNVHFFWSDERYVPPTDPASNYRMAAIALLSSLELPAVNIHRVQTELAPAGAAAEAYEREILALFRPGPGEVPKFDLVLLGLGTNGHTASLFPHSKALHENSRLVVADYVEEVSQWRITMTASLINSAQNVLFLVTGGEKAQVVKDVLFGMPNAEQLPAQLIQPSPGTSVWLMDRAAAGMLPEGAFTFRM